jgi:hypothetical protein
VSKCLGAGELRARARERGAPWRARVLLGLGFLVALAPGVARTETFQFFSGSTPFYLEGVDGVVVVKHPASRADELTGIVLDALPGWRSRTLFTAPAASAEAPAFSFFAHPSASATGFGFAGGTGAPPPASSTVAQVEAVVTLSDVFLSPLLLLSEANSCGVVVDGTLNLAFRPAVSEEEQLDLIESVGGVVLSRFSGTYVVRIADARTVFDSMAVVQGWMALSHFASVRFQAVSFVSPSCMGEIGFGTGGGGPAGGGGPQPLAVPSLSATTKLLLAACIAAVGALLIGRRR